MKGGEVNTCREDVGIAWFLGDEGLNPLQSLLPLWWWAAPGLTHLQVQFSDKKLQGEIQKSLVVRKFLNKASFLLRRNSHRFLEFTWQSVITDVKISTYILAPILSSWIFIFKWLFPWHLRDWRKKWNSISSLMAKDPMSFFADSYEKVLFIFIFYPKQRG